jgi:hypothetical protein
VGNNPASLTLVRGLDTDSTQYECPDFVTFAFQVRNRAVEFHIDEPSNILENKPTGVWAEFPNNSKHLRPEVTVIVLASSLPCLTEWLTGEAAANNLNCSDFFSIEFPYIRIHRHIRPVLVEYLGAERIHLAERNRLEFFGCPVQS